ncbi:DUF6722 family protein [Geoalkalibacter halelectricus]|uniref:DUF6722 family protein n=1 Tax=Geoalkalibacter halelectricus TaxID=2847045 RepID=UPI003D24F030
MFRQPKIKAHLLKFFLATLQRKNLREALSKFLVDMAKINFAIVFLTPAVAGNKAWWFLVGGFTTSLTLLVIGLGLVAEDDNDSKK